MAPLTRARAGREAVPNALMAEYYAQRASAGLIIIGSDRHQPRRPRLAQCAGPLE